MPLFACALLKIHTEPAAAHRKAELFVGPGLQARRGDEVAQAVHLAQHHHRHQRRPLLDGQPHEACGGAQTGQGANSGLSAGGAAGFAGHQTPG